MKASSRAALTALVFVSVFAQYTEGQEPAPGPGLLDGHYLVTVEVSVVDPAQQWGKVKHTVEHGSFLAASLLSHLLQVQCLSMAAQGHLPCLLSAVRAVLPVFHGLNLHCVLAFAVGLLACANVVWFRLWLSLDLS